MQVNSTGVGSFAASATLAPYLRVKRDATYGLVVAGPEDKELGTLRNRHIVSGLGTSEYASVVFANAMGTVKMVANGVITAWDVVYGAEDGKVSSTPNTNPIGIALETTTADGDYLEVLRLPNMSATSGEEIGGLDFFDDFLGDYPAAATALTEAPWTKVETNGLGVIPSDQANGVLKFSFDAIVEAATAALYMVNAPFDIDQNPIFEARVAIYDIGDDVALDINVGLASDTHATDFDSISEYIAFHLDGAALSIKAQSEDGVTTVAATDTLLDAVDDAFFKVKIDMTDTSDCKLYVDLEDGAGYVRVLATTTFDMSNYTGTLTPIIHVEKTNNDTTADVRADLVRVRSERA